MTQPETASPRTTPPATGSTTITISFGLDTTYYLYSDDGLIAEFDASGNEIQSYGYVPNSPWGTNPLYTKTAGAYAYYHTDHLGTPQMLTANNGAKVWEGKLDAFGQMTTTTGSITNNLRFSGQYYDQESEQHYNYFRNYTPRIGRYSTSDPIGLMGGLNAYVYVNGNPIVRSDPTGEFGPGGAVVGGVIGAISAVSGAFAAGATWDEAIIAGVVGGIVGGLSGFVGGFGVPTAMLFGGLTNFYYQLWALQSDNDPCNNDDVNWMSVAGSAIGAGWGTGITAAASAAFKAARAMPIPVSGIGKWVEGITTAIVAWAPNTAAGALGTALGEEDD